MIKKENILDAPCQLFSSLHPALDALEAVMAQQQEKIALARQALEQAKRLHREVEPTVWSARIEAARKNPDELARIRVLYDEEALAFMTVWLRWQDARNEMMAGRSAIHEAIIDALLARDDLLPQVVHWLKPIFEARLLVASRIHGEDIGDWLDLGTQDALIMRLHKIQAGAFRAMIAGLSRAMQHRPYTTDLVVNGKAMQSYLNDGVDLRKVWHCPLRDCLSSKHPASVKLAALFDKVEAALRVARDAENALKGDQNGRVNERQHAGRMLDFLHFDGGGDAAYYCGGNLDQQVEAQNVRRLDYECHHQALRIAVRSLRALVEELVETLKASAGETTELLGEVEADRRATVDRIDALRVMMNNCLAADACLRDYVRELNGLEKTIAADQSRGAGARTLGATFDEVVAKHYAYGVKSRREAIIAAATKGKQD